MKMLLSVFFGGAIGSVLRYSIGVWLARYASPGFPIATFSVNVVGSLCIGLLYAFSLQHPDFGIGWRLFLITGFCGGFTTFSAFAVENVLLLQQGHYASFALYSIASFACCLLAVFAGMFLAKG